MSDKQMIEEMAKVLRQHICEDKPCDKCNYHGKTKILPRYCEAYIHSKTLYNAGYRKIPEGRWCKRKSSLIVFSKIIIKI